MRMHLLYFQNMRQCVVILSRRHNIPCLHLCKSRWLTITTHLPPEISFLPAHPHKLTPFQCPTEAPISVPGTHLLYMTKCSHSFVRDAQPKKLQHSDPHYSVFIKLVNTATTAHFSPPIPSRAIMVTQAPPQLLMAQHSAPATQVLSGLQRSHGCGALFCCTPLKGKTINAFSSFCRKALLTLGGFLKHKLFIEHPIPNTTGNLHTFPSNMYAAMLHNMDEIVLPTAALVARDCVRPALQRDPLRVSNIAGDTLKPHLEEKGGTRCATNPQRLDDGFSRNHGIIPSVKTDRAQGVAMSGQCIKLGSNEESSQKPATSTTDSLHEPSGAPGRTTVGSVKGPVKNVPQPRFMWNVNAAEFFPPAVNTGTTGLARSTGQFTWNPEAAPFVPAGYDKRTARTDISATLGPRADGALSAWNVSNAARPVSRKRVRKFCALKKLPPLEAPCISGQSGDFPQRDRPSTQRDCEERKLAWHEAGALVPRAGDI